MQDTKAFLQEQKQECLLYQFNDFKPKCLISPPGRAACYP